MNTTLHTFVPAGPGYGLMMTAAIVIGAFYWIRRMKGNPDLLFIYIGALCGAFIGAKAAYLVAEGWMDWGGPHLWLRWATGKSVLGGLLGGYAGVELAKKGVGHRRSTGDAFALILPVGLFLGRIGCMLHGCCQGRPVSPGGLALMDAAGVPRWPAPQVEAVFQALMLVIILVLHHRGLLRDRLFFLYLVSYGLFRLVHEWMRDTPRLAWGLSGYHFLALGVVIVGTAGLWSRRKAGVAGFEPAA